MVGTGPGQVLVAVVSDGAGSASHGGDGSTLICRELVDRLSHAVPADASAGEAWMREAVIATRLAVLEYAAARDLAARDLAATVLCAVLAPTWSAYAQVGDGAIVTPDGTGEWSWLFWPQRGEYANSTTFLTDQAALESLQVDAMTGRQLEVALFTDGLQHLLLNYEHQQVHSPFFERMLVPVRASGVDGQDLVLSAGLVEYLGSAPVVERADDDLTLLLASQLSLASGTSAGPSPAGQVAAEPA